MIVTVTQGQTITDIILNNTGDIEFWNDVLNANPALTEWVPMLTIGQQIVIPDTIETNKNNVKQFSLYPLNNASVPDVYDQINLIFSEMANLTPITLSTVAQANYTANKGTSNNIAYILKIQNVYPVTYNYITQIIGSIYGQTVGADIATTGLKIYSNTTPDMAGSPTLVASFNPSGVLFDTYTANLLTVPVPANSILYILVTVNIDAAATTGHTLHVDGTDPLLITITGSPAQTNNQSDTAALITIGV